ncbi:MAG TPA: LysR family transcriptional regulator [Clostridiales bacterium]|nr:LysR family transcriptional regulator [Clostridiales bacterium]
MDILDLKYVAEVAKTGSMTQAAANLYMNQPNLSKAILALEKELGITIFRRSSKGVSLTREGTQFLLSTKEILEKFEGIEAKYKLEGTKHYFSISVPRASYISCAFAGFVREIAATDELQVDFSETSSMQVIQNVSTRKHHLGIIRYPLEYERYYHKLLRELDLCGDTLLEFEYMVLMSGSCPLANKKELQLPDLSGLIEIIHGDTGVPSLAAGEIRKPEHAAGGRKNIYIYERGSQFDLLTNVPSTYMWVSPVPQELLARYQLVQKQVGRKDSRNRDVVVYPNAYQMTDTDRKFLGHLYRMRDIIRQG